MSHQVLETLHYTQQHEWVSIDGDEVTVGITDYAQSSLGDIVFVELPPLGQELRRTEPFGVIESIKSVSDLYAPVSGAVVAVNDLMESSPGSCNQQPYECWMIKIKSSHPCEQLLTAQEYREFCNGLT